MARYIDAVKCADLISEKLNISIVDLVDIFAEIPTTDVAEVNHGEWIYNTDDFTPKMRCSVCGYNKPLVAGVIEQEPNDYCPHCGAKMDSQL